MADIKQTDSHSATLCWSHSVKFSKFGLDVAVTNTWTTTVTWSNLFCCCHFSLIDELEAGSKPWSDFPENKDGTTLTQILPTNLILEILLTKDQWIKIGVCFVSVCRVQKSILKCPLQGWFLQFKDFWRVRGSRWQERGEGKKNIKRIQTPPPKNIWSQTNSNCKENGVEASWWFSRALLPKVAMWGLPFLSLTEDSLPFYICPIETVPQSGTS